MANTPTTPQQGSTPQPTPQQQGETKTPRQQQGDTPQIRDWAAF